MIIGKIKLSWSHGDDIIGADYHLIFHCLTVDKGVVSEFKYFHAVPGQWMIDGGQIFPPVWRRVETDALGCKLDFQISREIRQHGFPLQVIGV